MKKYFSIAMIALAFVGANAQDGSDALRYSLPNYSGTARYNALSGAFGALGGDLSAISSNPASSVIFANNQLGLSLNHTANKLNNNYYGTRNSDQFNHFDLNQAGGVFVFNSKKEDSKGPNKFAIGFNYANLNNFDSEFYSSGTSINSIDKYFLHYAQGVRLGDINTFAFEDLTFAEQQASLAYEAYIIDPIPLASDPLNYGNPNIVNYSSAVLPGTFNQKNDISSTGYNGKFSINGSMQFNNRISIGANINIHFTDYVKSSTFTESNNNNTSTTTYVRGITFNNDLHTSGNGFSAQLGGIFKVNEMFRLGVSFETPTWISLTDELTQSISATSYNTTDGDLPADSFNPNITMTYEPYTVRTPGKITLSGALVFGKIGLISVDYGTRNYANMNLSPNNEFTDANINISNTFTRANDLRVGGEIKAKQWSFRAGTSIEQSPYKDKTMMGDMKGYSAGIGYNFGSTKLDFAFGHKERDYAQQQFNVGLTDRAFVNSKQNSATVSIAFEL